MQSQSTVGPDGSPVQPFRAGSHFNDAGSGGLASRGSRIALDANPLGEVSQCQVGSGRASGGLARDARSGDDRQTRPGTTPPEGSGSASPSILDTKHYPPHTHPHTLPDESPVPPVEARLKRLGKLKLEQLAMAEWEGPSDGLFVWRTRRGKDGKPDKTVPDKARSWSLISDSMKSCGAWLRFRKIMAGDRAGETRLHKAYFCNRRGLCCFCDHHRANKIVRKFAPRALTILREGERRRAVLMTCTLRNGDDLAERFGFLSKSISSWFMRRTNAATGGRHKTELSKVVAGAGSFEVKRGKGSGKWHPHFHAVLICDGPLDWKRCWEEWRRITKGDGGVNFQPFHSQVAFDHGLTDRATFESQLTNDLREVFKYPLKGDRGFSRSDRFRAYLELYNKVLIRSFGEMRDVEISDDLTDEPLEWDRLTYQEILYYYGHGDYVQQGGGVLHVPDDAAADDVRVGPPPREEKPAAVARLPRARQMEIYDEPFT